MLDILSSKSDINIRNAGLSDLLNNRDAPCKLKVLEIYIAKKNVHTWTQFNSQQLHSCSGCPNPEAVASELFPSHIPDMIDMPANIKFFVESFRQRSS